MQFTKCPGINRCCKCTYSKQLQYLTRRKHSYASSCLMCYHLPSSIVITRRTAAHSINVQGTIGYVLPSWTPSSHHHQLRQHTKSRLPISRRKRSSPEPRRTYAAGNAALWKSRRRSWQAQLIFDRGEKEICKDGATIYHENRLCGEWIWTGVGHCRRRRRGLPEWRRDYLMIVCEDCSG